MNNYSADKGLEDSMVNNGFNFIESNEIEEEISRYKKQNADKIKFNIILKPLLISFIALIVSFFIDLAYVPILGNVTLNFARSLFPGWVPINQSIVPLNFWWIPLLSYLVFLGFAYKAFLDLKTELSRPGVGTSSEIIDRISGSAISVVDGVSTALPIIGAAILLISIKLGPEIFLGLSVPFEIKSLIVLALGKLFEPVFDKLGIEFQHIINRATEIKENYFIQVQIKNTNKLLHQIGTRSANLTIPEPAVSPEDLLRLNSAMETSMNLAKETTTYLKATHQLMEKINSLPVINQQRLDELNKLTSNILRASESLKDEKTITALKSLENIIEKRQS
jgi:hypothetical protein